MITDNLTNTVYFSGLLPEKCPILNAHITEALQQHDVSCAYLSGTKDIWCRGFMPKQGVVEAQFNIAMFYKFGRGVRKSQAKCLKWLTKAAEQGDEKAQYNLAKLGNPMLRQR